MKKINSFKFGLIMGTFITSGLNYVFLDSPKSIWLGILIVAGFAIIDFINFYKKKRSLKNE